MTNRRDTASRSSRLSIGWVTFDNWNTIRRCDIDHTKSGADVCSWRCSQGVRTRVWCGFRGSLGRPDRLDLARARRHPCHVRSATRTAGAVRRAECFVGPRGRAIGSPGLAAWGNTDGQLSNSAEEQRTWRDRCATLKDPGCSGQPRGRLTGHDPSSQALQIRGKPEDVSKQGGHSNGRPSKAATGLDGRSISLYARLRDTSSIDRLRSITRYAARDGARSWTACHFISSKVSPVCMMWSSIGTSFRAMAHIALVFAPPLRARSARYSLR